MAKELQKSWLEDVKLLTKVADRTEKQHSSRLAEDKAYLRLYWDRAVPGAGVDYNRPYRELAIYDHLKEQPGNNLTVEVVDAASSILCRNMAAKISPKGSDFELDQGCKEATRLVDGVYENSNFLQTSTEAARDGMTASFGPVRGFIENEEIKIERVNPLDVFWVNDGTDNPRTLFTVTAVPKDKLRAEYPGKWDRIKDIRTWAPQTVVGVDLPGQWDRDADTVKVVEAWCRAIGPDVPGRHSIVCGEVVLHDEKWTHEITPISRFRWSPDFRGYAGRSLARIVGKYDVANRRLLRMIYAGLAGAVPWVVHHEDEDVQISDVEFQRVPYSNREPKVVMPQTVSPQIIEQLERNRNLAFAEGGINQGMATGNAPARYTSGAAQREYVDIANARMLLAQHQWETFWRETSEVVIMLLQQARRANVRVKGAKYWATVNYPKLPRDKFAVSFGLVSGLSITPSARKQDMKDLQEMGLADIADVARGLNIPDLQETADRLNAPRDLILQQVSLALDKGVFSMPGAIQGQALNDLVTIAGQEYQRARLQGNYPPAHMEVLRRLWLAAKARVAPPPAPLPANDVTATTDQTQQPTTAVTETPAQVAPVAATA